MLYSNIVNLIRKGLAGELVSEVEILSFADRAIDDINTQLNTKFPVLTEFKQINIGTPPEELDYNVFPDKYIRTVVIPGALVKYYVADEEGNEAARKYDEDYRQGLFYMTRDYSFKIPEEYREDEQGYVDGIDNGDPLAVAPYRGIF